MSAKYEFTGETIVVYGKTLQQIRRLKDGAIGGYIEAEKNLSQAGDAWVSGDARVSGDAWVSGNAWVSGDARVSGDAWVSGDAQVSGDAWVSGDATIEKPFDYVHIAGLRYAVAIRNDGYASIGCTTKTIDEWLATTFDQTELCDRQDEFDLMRQTLLPMFVLFNERFKMKAGT